MNVAQLRIPSTAGRFVRKWWSRLTVAVLLTAVVGGCSRTHYRRQADAEAYCLIENKAVDPHWELNDYTIEKGPDSRLFDPFDADCPPMPPDDPTAHKLMHCVGGMCGDGCWHKNGDAPFVEDRAWLDTLPRNERGEVPLNLRSAVQLGLVNSRQYQNELEDLYLSALDVSFERFRFDAVFSFGGSAFATTSGRNRFVEGGNSSTDFDVNTNLGVNQLFANGGQLMVGLANSLMWQVSGPNDSSATTVLDFTLVQPLLRGGGRARVLERLTLSERTLLYNVRQMERYRRGFFARIASGRDPGQGPQRRGGVLGAGLSGFSGVGTGGFGGVAGGFGGGGGGGGGVAGGAGAGQAGGFFGLLQQQQQIINREANFSSLRDSLAQLEAAYQAGRIDRFQVDLAQQAVFNAQSQLLTTQAQFQTQFDAFKVILGLPPQLETTLDDPLLNRFQLIHPVIPPLQNRLADAQEDAGALIVEIGERAVADDFAVDDALLADIQELTQVIASAVEVHQAAQEHFADVRVDVEELVGRLDDRRKNLERLAETEGSSSAIDIIRADIGRLTGLPDKLKRDLASLEVAFNEVPEQMQTIDAQLRGLGDVLAKVPAENRPQALTTVFGEVSDALTTLSSYVLELSLIQARARAESIVLEPIDLESEEAIEIARRFRRDWMNARAALVDVWRLIEFNANDLLTQLDVVVSGDVANRGDNPIQLDDTSGQLRVGLQFDTPIQRLAERNNYRQALIEFQRARRDYMQFEDQVAQTLRNTIRSIELDQLNFELRRAAIRVAIDQVELARLRLREPPQPGVAATFGATTARDLVSALTDLLSVQNDFLSVWVDYQVERINLDFDLGTMQLDEYGMWIDPGANLGDLSRIDYADPNMPELRGENCTVPVRETLEPIPLAPPAPEEPVEEIPDPAKPVAFFEEDLRPLQRAKQVDQQHDEVVLASPLSKVSPRSAKVVERPVNPLRSR